VVTACSMAMPTAWSLLDQRSESAWESVLRVLHVVADVDVEPQREIFAADGTFVARADLWLVGTRRIHEYDGAGHRDAETHRADLARERRLVDERWERCGYTSREVLRRGRDVIAAADAALGRPWVQARLDAWRALVARSLYGSVGRQRALARWSRANR
jgi:very-short-patch-repair endonuclease